MKFSEQAHIWIEKVDESSLPKAEEMAVIEWWVNANWYDLSLLIDENILKMDYGMVAQLWELLNAIEFKILSMGNFYGIWISFQYSCQKVYWISSLQFIKCKITEYQKK